MKFAKKPMTQARRAQSARCGGGASSSWSRLARVRAAVFVLIWILPGVSCAAQSIVDGLEHGLAHVHEQEVGNRISKATVDHQHGHDHPEPQPAILKANTPAVDGVALFSEVSEVRDPEVKLRIFEKAVLARSSVRFVVGASPRAPPSG